MSLDRTIAQLESDLAWSERRAKSRHESLKLEGAVLKFLRENPWSTNEEIFAATGGTAGCGARFITHSKVRRGGPKPVRVYSVNEEKLQKWIKGK